MIIYLDILIAENLIINFFLLYLTCKTIKIIPNYKMLFFSALLGGIYIITKVYSSLFWLTILPLKLLVALLMIFIITFKCGFILKMKAFLIFLVYSMLLAGLSLFIELNIQSYNTFNVHIFNGNYKELIIALILTYLSVSITTSYIKERRNFHSLLFNVDMEIKGVNKKFVALMDTGNDLKEPVTRFPVVIVQENIIYDINLDENRLYNIPYKVVDGKSSLLKGFIPQYIKIYNKYTTIDNPKVIIAVCNNKLSENNDFNALLSRGLIENGGEPC